MWPLLLGLWKARRGRKAAVGIIAPFVTHSRQHLGSIPDSVWLHPYLVGFMVMFITLVARREVNVLDTQALGLVQSGAWAEITGLRPELIGEETLHCCAVGDRDFERGCRDAIDIDLALYRSSAMRNADIGFTGAHHGLGLGMNGERDPEADNIMLLWENYFDTHILSHVAAHDAAPEQEPDAQRTA